MLKLINADGTPNEEKIAAINPSPRAKREARQEQWAARQRLDTEALKERAVKQTPLVPKGKKVQPLRPKNVKNGVPVEDPEVLDAIAERTAAIEAAKAAETE